MNCKVCGTRLGILERWRYGDFCSQEHKVVFADDLESLDKQLSPEGGQSASPKPRVQETASNGATGQAETEFEPAMAGFMVQQDPKPRRPLRLEERISSKPAAERMDKAGERWRILAKKAGHDALPAPSRMPSPA